MKSIWRYIGKDNGWHVYEKPGYDTVKRQFEGVPPLTLELTGEEEDAFRRGEYHVRPVIATDPGDETEPIISSGDPRDVPEQVSDKSMRGPKERSR